MKIALKIDHVVERATEVFCCVILLAIVLICFINALSRYVFAYTFVWADELVRFMSVWLTIVGASLTARAGQHTTLDILQEVTRSRKAKAALYALTRIITVAILACLLPSGFELLRVYGGSRSSGTGLPGWVLYAAYPVGVVTIIIAYLRTAPVRFLAILKGE